MFILIFICIVLAGAVGCTLVGIGHERGIGLMITVGFGLVWVSMLALAFHP